MLLPAWAYLYTKAEFPQRGIVAWAALGEDNVPLIVDGSPLIWKRAEAVKHIAATFGISEVNARVLVRKGQGIFWHVDGKNLYPYDRLLLWRAVADESIVPEDEYVNVPDEALRSLALTRAYLAQPVLTRGPAKPISVAASGVMLGRSDSAITQYRKHLAKKGRLQIFPQYQRLREERVGLRMPPLAPGEYIDKGWVYRRTADIVVIFNAIGDMLAWPVHKVEERIMAARRYFSTVKQLDDWLAAGKKVAKDAVLHVFEDWIPLSNVVKGVYGDSINTNTTMCNTEKNIYQSRNVRGNPSLKNSSKNFRQNPCIPALEGVK